MPKKSASMIKPCVCLPTALLHALSFFFGAKLQKILCPHVTGGGSRFIPMVWGERA
jgi:hypothetical protein